MRHIVTVGVGLLAVLVFSLELPGAAQSRTLTGTLSLTPGQATELVSTAAELIRQERAGNLRATSVVNDRFAAGYVHERLQQFHLGLPVVGGEITRHTLNGIVSAVFGQVLTIERPDARPRLDEAQAQALLSGAYGAAATRATLKWFGATSTASLVYESFLPDEFDPFVVYMDADTGAEGAKLPLKATQAAVGEGLGVLGDRKKISTRSSGNGFQADDVLRPPTLQTIDLRGDTVRFSQYIQGRVPGPADLAVDTDNTWTDPVAVDAHVHMGWTYDYLFKQFAFRGLNDANAPIYGGINLYSPQQCGAFSNSDSRLSFCINAGFINPGPGGVGLMFFGNGSSTVRGGQAWRPLAGGLDVVAHELAHGITANTSRLVYQNESGALNEAFSDLIGFGAEAYFQPRGTQERQADYLMGEDVVKEFAPGARDGIRSFSNPGNYGDPDHYWFRHSIGATRNFDSGGVHSNSGIMNHAFFLAIEGGTHQSGQRVTGVGYANRDQIEKAFFRAFAYYLTSRATFYQARLATIQAARDLYGPGGAADRALTQAWDAVGVASPGAALTTAFTPNPVPPSTAACDGARPTFFMDVAVSEFQGVAFDIHRFDVVTFDTAGRQIGEQSFTAQTFASWFNRCGAGNSRIPAGGRACARVCASLGGRAGGLGLFYFDGVDANGNYGSFVSDVLFLGVSGAAADEPASVTPPSFKKAS